MLWRGCGRGDGGGGRCLFSNLMDRNLRGRGGIGVDRIVQIWVTPKQMASGSEGGVDRIDGGRRGALDRNLVERAPLPVRGGIDGSRDDLCLRVRGL